MIALQRDLILGLVPVHPETALRLGPAVMGAGAGEAVEGIAARNPWHRCGSPHCPRADRHIGLALLLYWSPTPSGQQPALGVGRLAGDDIDHAIDRVGAPQACRQAR